MTQAEPHRGGKRLQCQRKSIWLLAGVLLLAALVSYLNLYSGYKFYAFLIAGIALLLLVIRRTNLILIMIPVLIVLVFSSDSVNALINLRTTTKSLKKDTDRKISTLFTPRSGLQVLPRQATQVNDLIEEFKIPSYRLTSEILQDQKVMQRVIESTWPVTLSDNSPYLFGFTGEITKFPNCTVLKSEQDIDLGYCH